MTENPRGPGAALVYCQGCHCVAIHDGTVGGPHHWIERTADAAERASLGGVICNVCAPRPDLLCEVCVRIAHDSGTGYIWEFRTPTSRELHRLPRRRCPNCPQTEKIAAGAP